MPQAKLEDRVVKMEQTFSRRIAELEAEVSHLSQQIKTQPANQDTAWWKKIVGIYKDDPEFEEAMRLGREYRQSQRPPDGEGAP
jgi:hypothetical protein